MLFGQGNLTPHPLPYPASTYPSWWWKHVHLLKTWVRHERSLENRGIIFSGEQRGTHVFMTLHRHTTSGGFGGFCWGGEVASKPLKCWKQWYLWKHKYTLKRPLKTWVCLEVITRCPPFHTRWSDILLSEPVRANKIVCHNLSKNRKCFTYLKLMNW